MSWDFDFDEDSSFLSSNFGDQFDGNFGSSFDSTFFTAPQNQPEQPNIPDPTIQPIQQAQQFPQQPPMQQQFYPQMQPQPFYPQMQQTDYVESQNLMEENNQLRQFFLSLKQKAEMVENQNQKLKGQLNECRNWFRNAMFSGIQRTSNKK